MKLNTTWHGRRAGLRPPLLSRSFVGVASISLCSGSHSSLSSNTQLFFAMTVLYLEKVWLFIDVSPLSLPREPFLS